MNVLGIKDNDRLSISHRKWVEEVLKEGSSVRKTQWTESIAVGSKTFIEVTREKLGAQAIWIGSLRLQPLRPGDSNRQVFN